LVDKVFVRYQVRYYGLVKTDFGESQ